jgi:hypothetical protein
LYLKSRYFNIYYISYIEKCQYVSGIFVSGIFYRRAGEAGLMVVSPGLAWEKAQARRAASSGRVAKAQ